MPKLPTWAWIAIAVAGGFLLLNVMGKAALSPPGAGAGSPTGA